MMQWNDAVEGAPLMTNVQNTLINGKIGGTVAASGGGGV